ncbi:MAG: peptidoglycan-binding domain-containing protein, partial [Anaerolineae bacterium]
MKATAVRLVQQALVAEGLSPGKIDGRLGPKTYDAVAAALAKRSAELPAGWREWSNRRRCVAMLQLLCKAQEIAVGRIDGLWGPQTEYAYDMLAYHHEHGRLPPPFRDETPLDVNPNGWPRQTEAELIRYYGEIGKNQTMLTLPYPHRLAWDLRKTVKKFSCHEKVHDSALRVLQRVLSHYGPERITELRLDRWAGCLNERKMRGGNRWSLHAWGIA